MTGQFIPGWVADADDIGRQLATHTWPQSDVMEARLRLIESYRAALGLGGNAIADLDRRAFHCRPLWESAYDRLAEVDGLLDDLPLTIADRVARRQHMARESLANWPYSKPSLKAPVTMNSTPSRFIPQVGQAHWEYTDRHAVTGNIISGLGAVSGLSSGKADAEAFLADALDEHQQGKRVLVGRPDGEARPFLSRNEPIAGSRNPGASFDELAWISDLDVFYYVAINSGVTPEQDVLSIGAEITSYDPVASGWTVPPGTSLRQLGGPTATTEDVHVAYNNNVVQRTLTLFWDRGPEPNYDLAGTGEILAELTAGTTLVDWSPVYEVIAANAPRRHYVSVGLGYPILSSLPDLPLLYATGVVGPDAETDLPTGAAGSSAPNTFVERRNDERDGRRDYASALWFYGAAQNFVATGELAPAIQLAEWPHAAARQPNAQPLY